MLTKELFVKTMETVCKLADIETKINDIYRENDLDYCYFPTHSVYEQIIVDLLEEAMGDKWEFISYWLYECNYGKDIKPDSVQDEDKTPIDLTTLDKLYDYIVSCREG